MWHIDYTVMDGILHHYMQIHKDKLFMLYTEELSIIVLQINVKQDWLYVFIYPHTMSLCNINIKSGYTWCHTVEQCL